MWSKTKKKLDSYLADSLKGRLEYHCSNYRMHEGIGRVYITFDKEEVYNMCTLKRDYYRTPKDGLFSQVEFLQAVYEYQTNPITVSLQSSNPLIRMLAVLDRRVGKRTLDALRDKIESENDIVCQFYEIRRKAEEFDSSPTKN